MKPCIQCGEPTDGSRCSEHTIVQHKISATQRGYDSKWTRLSQRARRLQPWCLDCGTTDDLTVDHSPEAWKRHESRREITLDLVDVVCRSCNSKRGRARWGEDPPQDLKNPRCKPQTELRMIPNSGEAP